ncbi:M48 family metalloprotease [Breoghania sp.]|uniref:M48 family metalloprotease n=1 Tax=Breoghania sp. TaxID=2065378 RepID=UPI0026290BCC|nr:M48 family metalloprotease [Breoghania sp.]MDJ0932639.1 M48 family metalloprotease [Breoghania sp.]
MASVLAGCQLISSSKIPLNNNSCIFFNGDSEASIGAREHPRVVASYGGVYKNAGAEEAVARAVGRLVAASEDPSQTYKITILNSPAVNAFALPGGYLYVSRGLLALANDTSEMAAVLAHEMAHVTAHHGAARQQQEAAAALASKVVTNIVDDPEQVEAAVASSQRSFARFTQAQELQADSIGVRTLARAGFDPYAAARFLESMGRYSKFITARGDEKAAPDFISTHPSTPDRIARAIREARQIGAPGIGEQDRSAYLAKLDGMLYGDDPLQGFVRGRSFLHKALGSGFTVPAGFQLENTPQAVLASDGKGTALRFDGADLVASESLPDYIQSGWINGLVDNSIRHTTVNGLPAVTATALAEGWSFRIGLVRKGETVYRFILATRDPSEAFLAAFDETLKSFRQLSPTEQARLRPLTIRVVKVLPGQTIHDLARRMSGIAPARRVKLFTLLNGLDDEVSLTVGQSVKLVVD